MCGDGLKKILILGAGNIGLGVVGEIFHRNGYRPYFYRRNQDILDELKSRGHYLVVSRDKEKIAVNYVNHFGVIRRQELAEEMGRTDLAACCLYPAAFEEICGFISQAVRYRSRYRKESLFNILLCVNQPEALAQFTERLTQGVLGDREAEEYLHSRTGISQVLVLSAALPDLELRCPQNETVIVVSHDRRLEIDGSTFLGKQPPLESAVFVEGVREKLLRKLYLGNMRHAMAAFMGASMGYETVGECHRDPYIRSCICKAFEEAERGLLAEYSFEEQEYKTWRNSAIEKLDLPSRDKLQRVAANPGEKLKKGERFIGPALLCLKHKTEVNCLALGIAYGLEYMRQQEAGESEQSIRPAKLDLQEILKKVCQMDPEDEMDRELMKIIICQYDKISKKAEVNTEGD